MSCRTCTPKTDSTCQKVSDCVVLPISDRVDPGGAFVGLPLTLDPLDATLELDCGETIDAAITEFSPTSSYRTDDEVTNARFLCRRFTINADEVGEYIIKVTNAAFSPVITAVRTVSEKFQKLGDTLKFTLTNQTIGPIVLEISTEAPYGRGHFSVNLECPSVCPVPAAFAWNCPTDGVYKSYQTSFFNQCVAHVKPTNRVWVGFNGSNKIDIIDFTQVVPALDVQITLPSGGASTVTHDILYHPSSDKVVAMYQPDQNVSSKVVQFMTKTGGMLTQSLLAGGASSGPHTAYLIPQTRKEKYVYLFVTPVTLTNGWWHALFVINPTTETVVQTRLFSAGPADPSYSSFFCYNCELNEVVLTYRTATNTWLHRINASDINDDIGFIDLGVTHYKSPIYEPTTKKLIMQYVSGAGFDLHAVQLHPETGAIENDVIIDTLTVVYKEPVFNFKLSALVQGGDPSFPSFHWTITKTNPLSAHCDYDFGATFSGVTPDMTCNEDTGEMYGVYKGGNLASNRGPFSIVPT